MIICHCRVVSDRAVRQAIACGAAGLCAVAEACQAATRCGGCLPAVRELLDEHGLPTDDHLTARDIRRAIGATAGAEGASPARRTA